MAVNTARISDEEKANRIEEIKARAKKVYNLSFDYHLAHAVFGSDGLLLYDRKEYKSEENKKLFNAVLRAVEEGDKSLQKKLKEEGDTLKREFQHRKYCILVEYIPMDDIYGGRVVIVDDKLKISLPEKLKEGIINEKGELDSASINNLREIMAHELGHIVLHTEKIPPDPRGSKGLASFDWEAEAFAEELLYLYKKQKHPLECAPPS